MALREFLTEHFSIFKGLSVIEGRQRLAKKTLDGNSHGQTMKEELVGAILCENGEEVVKLKEDIKKAERFTPATS